MNPISVSDFGVELNLLLNSVGEYVTAHGLSAAQARVMIEAGISASHVTRPEWFDPTAGAAARPLAGDAQQAA